MDAVMERRVLKRLGRSSRLDKKCGESGIPDDAKCSKKQGDPSVTASNKESPASNKARSHKVRNLLLVAGLWGAIQVAGKYAGDRVAERILEKNFNVSKEEARNVRKGIQDAAKKGPEAANAYYSNWVKEKLSQNTTQTRSGKKWHETLGVSPNATPAEIKSAYRKKSRETHPDINQGEDKGFSEVNEAWEIAQNLGKYKRGDAMDELDKAYEMGMRVAKSRVRRDSVPAIVPKSLHPQIVSTLKTVYGNGVLGVSNSKINKDGQIEGVFVGRSRPTEPAKVYNYGIDLVKQNVRFKRARATRDSEDEECCGGKKKGCECHSCQAV